MIIVYWYCLYCDTSPSLQWSNFKDWQWSRQVLPLVKWPTKVNRIQCCDWLPGRTRWPYLGRSGLPAISHKKMVFFVPYNNTFTDKACSVKMAGYWPRSETSLKLKPLSNDTNIPGFLWGVDGLVDSGDFLKEWSRKKIIAEMTSNSVLSLFTLCSVLDGWPCSFTRTLSNVRHC